MKSPSRPSLESLETRLTPSSASYDGSGNLVVTGNATASVIYVNTNNQNNVLVQINGVTLTDGGSPFVINSGAHVLINGGAGNDSIQLAGLVDGEIYGGDGNDSITSGSGNDVIFCGDGNDIADGGAGNDVIEGGAGADRLHATSGNDILVGGSFNPSRDYASLRSLGDSWSSSGGGVVGAAATDPLLFASPSSFVSDPHDLASRDVLYCGSGNDWLIAGMNDIISGLSFSGNDYKSVV